MSEEMMIIKKLLTLSKQFDLAVEDEAEFKVNGTMQMKVQVPDGKKWLLHASFNIEEIDI